MTLLSSLTNRIFVASALLVAVAIGLAVYRVERTVTAQAEAELRSGLADAASLVDDYSRTQFDDFVGTASLIADLPKLMAAASTEDPPTVKPIAAEYQRRLDSDLFVVLGRTDRVLANAGRVQPGEAEIARMLAACRSRTGGTTFQPHAGMLIHAIALPLQPGPSSPGTLLAGFTLGGDFAARIKAVTKSDIALTMGSEVIASTLDAPSTTALAATLPAPPGVFVRRLGAADYVARVQRLGPTAADDEPAALVLRSRTDQLRFLSTLRWQLTVTGLVAMLLSTVVGYALARTVTRPVRAITATMRHMAATGDLAGTVPAGGRWDDEDARLLTSTFRQLTTALDGFQREAAQRERLSALGRWSTVVAHEIRNPLMILKSAARSLRKRMAPDTADLAASIDEEVRRLNDVVTGVLDFARPIPFQLAPADLHEICLDAARAVEAGPGAVPVVVEPAATPAAPGRTTAMRINTDAERLRSVMINLLTNAQNAVHERKDGGLATPPIRLSVRAIGDARWAIDVVDRGVGIADADLPRLFEPFFTTRKTGSGLGLALARNIIEGLGGTIAVESRPGAGTTVHIELPERPMRAEGRA